MRVSLLTRFVVEAGESERPREELESYDGVDDDDEQHQQGNVQQGDHRLQDRVQHDLQT